MLKLKFRIRKGSGNHSHDFRKRKLLRNCAILHSQWCPEWNPHGHAFCFIKAKAALPPHCLVRSIDGIHSHRGELKILKILQFKFIKIFNSYLNLNKLKTKFSIYHASDKATFIMLVNEFCLSSAVVASPFAGISETVSTQSAFLPALAAFM